MNNNIKLSLVFSLIVGALIIAGCVDLSGLNGLFRFVSPEGGTLTATEITDTSAILNGIVKGGSAAQKVSFIYYIGDLSGKEISIDANPG
jgi:hypothetical protein